LFFKWEQMSEACGPLRGDPAKWRGGRGGAAALGAILGGGDLAGNVLKCPLLAALGG